MQIDTEKFRKEVPTGTRFLLLQLNFNFSMARPDTLTAPNTPE